MEVLGHELEGIAELGIRLDGMVELDDSVRLRLVGAVRL